MNYGINKQNRLDDTNPGPVKLEIQKIEPINTLLSQPGNKNQKKKKKAPSKKKTYLVISYLRKQGKPSFLTERIKVAQMEKCEINN